MKLILSLITIWLCVPSLAKPVLRTIVCTKYHADCSSPDCRTGTRTRSGRSAYLHGFAVSRTDPEWLRKCHFLRYKYKGKYSEWLMRDDTGPGVLGKSNRKYRKYGWIDLRVSYTHNQCTKWGARLVEVEVK